MDLSLEGLNLMQIEWDAWRDICRELDRLSIDLNKQERLHAAVVRWGEELVQLRLQQEPSVISTALQEKRELAHKHLTK